jgi:hypothetical protein
MKITPEKSVRLNGQIFLFNKDFKKKQITHIKQCQILVGLLNFIIIIVLSVSGVIPR